MAPIPLKTSISSKIILSNKLSILKHNLNIKRALIPAVHTSLGMICGSELITTDFISLTQTAALLLYLLLQHSTTISSYSSLKCSKLELNTHNWFGNAATLTWRHCSPTENSFYTAQSSSSLKNFFFVYRFYMPWNCQNSYTEINTITMFNHTNFVKLLIHNHNDVFKGKKYIIMHLCTRSKVIFTKWFVCIKCYQHDLQKSFLQSPYLVKHA